MESLKVYVRKDDSTVDDDETWDDRLLIDAYNKSVNRIKKKIAHRMGLVNGDDQDSDDKPVPEGRKSKVGSKNGKNIMKWNVGDFCRAKYSVDGLEYEAKIIRILPNKRCVVKYCGYDNEETVKIKNLKPSNGEQSRVKQQLLASSGQSEIIENSDISDNGFENYGMGYNFTHSSSSPIPGIPSVPPPPPFNLTSQFGMEGESDALSAMLMSWYMAGYHAGYYQALLESKKVSKQK